MKKIKLKMFVIAISIFLVAACKKSSDTPNAMANYNGGVGIFVNNEGDAGHGNGSISFINNVNNTVITDVFSAANGRPLGDEAQSMTIYNGKGYIVLNGSQSIQIVNITNFKSDTTITSSNNISLKSPRYMLVVNDTTAYISDWNDNNIKVLNLSSLIFKTTIPTGVGPEQMVIANGNVYVSNSGGDGTDSTITVINNNQVIATIHVSQNPYAMAVDSKNMLWVMCTNYAGGGVLVKIDPSTNKVVKPYPVPGNPGRLAINKEGNSFFYEGTNGIYKFSITDTAASQTPLIPLSNSTNIIYGVTVDPHNDNIYGAVIPGYSSDGTMYEYDSTGKQLNTYGVGICSDKCLFNY